MSDNYAYTPVIPRTGLAASLAGATAITNEMLWTTDSKCLYIEQGGEKILIGGNYSHPLELTVGSSTSTLMEVKNQTYTSINDISGRYGSRMYVPDNDGQLTSTGLFIRMTDTEQAIQQAAITIEIEEQTGGVGNAAVGLAILSENPGGEIIYVAALPGASGLIQEIAIWASEDDPAGAGAYNATMQAEELLGKGPHPSNSGFGCLWGSDQTIPTYGAFYGSLIPANCFVVRKTEGALDTNWQIAVMDYASPYVQPRFAVYNNGDVLISGEEATSGDQRIDSAQYIFRGNYWNGLYSIHNEISLYMDTAPADNEVFLCLNVEEAGGGIYDSWPCTLIYASVDNQVALGDATHRFTSLSLSTALYLDSDAATSGTTTVDSPNIILRGAYWSGSASVDQDWKIFNDVTATTPASALLFVDPASNTRLSIGSDGAVNVTGSVDVSDVYKVDGTQVVSNRVIDARIDDTINESSWDSTTAGVLDALRDAAITHGLLAAA